MVPKGGISPMVFYQEEKVEVLFHTNLSVS